MPTPSAVPSALPVHERRFFEAILGVPAPWRIEHADLSLTEARLDLYVGHLAGSIWPCPECHTELPCHDLAARRTWRHLDACQFLTLVHASVPRVECPRHAVRDVGVPWANAGSLYTTAMERHIIGLIQRGGVSEAARTLRIDWADAWRLGMSRRTGV
jgi:transposase